MEERINEYMLLAPFQNENAGFSRWTYAKRNGRDYFLKEFLNPIYPDQDSLSEKLRQNLIYTCQKFEEKKCNLYKAIDDASDGNLVRIFEFFRYDSHYYIAMPRVKSEKISFKDIARLPFEDRILLCRTAAQSIMKMHDAHIVHSDIKENNVMIHKTRTGKFTAKIIDFDCSFFESDPPKNEDDLGGDQIYLSPEACMFFCGNEVKLCCKMDIFALGLLFHQYLTGELPYFDTSEYDYAHEAVLDDSMIVVSNALQEPLRSMIANMLAKDPDDRIDIYTVFNTLGQYIEQNKAEDEVFWKDDSSMYDKITEDYDDKQPEDFFRIAGNL